MGKLASHRALAGRRSTKRSTGGYGSKRDTPAKSAKQVTRRQNRLANGRVKEALEEARAAEEAIASMPPVVDEVLAPADGAALGAQYGALTKQALGQVKIKTSPTSAWRPTGLTVGYACPMCASTFHDCDTKQRSSRRSCCRHCDEVGDDVAHQTAPEEKPPPFEPWEGDGRDGYIIGDARRQIMQGYHIQGVARRTGVGAKWLIDLVNKDGYAKETS